MDIRRRSIRQASRRTGRQTKHAVAADDGPGPRPRAPRPRARSTPQKLAALQRPDRAPVLGHLLLSLHAISFGVRDELIGFPCLPRSAVQQRVSRHRSVLLLRDPVFVRAVLGHIRQYRTRRRQTLLVRTKTCTLQYMSGVSGRTDTSLKEKLPECRSTAPAGSGRVWGCSLPTGHAGKHAAKDIAGMVVHRWRRRVPAKQST